MEIVHFRFKTGCVPHVISIMATTFENLLGDRAFRDEMIRLPLHRKTRDAKLSVLGHRIAAICAAARVSQNTVVRDAYDQYRRDELAHDDLLVVLRLAGEA